MSLKGLMTQRLPKLKRLRLRRLALRQRYLPAKKPPVKRALPSEALQKPWPLSLLALWAVRPSVC
jgi:hypothetical protein